MNGKAVLDLVESVVTLSKDGISEWNGHIFAKDMKHIAKSECSAVESQLTTLLLNVSRTKHHIIRSYMSKKVYTTLSQADTPVGSISSGFSQDLGGSPLQLPEILGDMSLVENGVFDSAILDHKYLVPEAVFQEMISYLRCAFTSYNLGEAKDLMNILKNIFPMVVFCDWENKHRDRNGIVYIESSTDSSGKFCGFIVRKFQIWGQYPCTTWYKEVAHGLPYAQSSAKSPQVHSQCLKHLSDLHQREYRRKTSSAVSIESYSEYELLDSNKDLINEHDVMLSFAAVSVSCDKVQKILSINSQHVSETKVHIAPVPGDMRSPAFSLYQSISKIERLVGAFKKSGEVELNTDVVPSRASQSNLDNVKQLLESYNREWKSWRTVQVENKPITPDKNETLSEDRNTSKKMLLLRSEFDFTERIWEALKDIQSIDELVESFEFILSTIKGGNTATFWLHRNNLTMLAKIVRESYTGPIVTKIEISPKNAIALLIELGLDKLFRDYHHFFVGNHGLVASCLGPYIKVEACDEEFDRKVEKLKSRFVLLQKLHHTVELVVQSKMFLRLPDEIVFAVAKTVLRDYVSEKLDFEKKFTFAVDYGAVETMIVDRLPSLWKLTLSSKEKGAEINLLHLDARIPFERDFLSTIGQKQASRREW